MSPSLEALIEAAWPKAQARWATWLSLGAPRLDAGCPSVAQIHLGTREVTLDRDELTKHQLDDCIEALLAHEVGHHVRYPGTLAVQARLRLMERTLIPFEGVSLLNMFTDLMINEHLGPHYHTQFAKLYRALVPVGEWARGPATVFYMAVYEELWQLDQGSLMGAAHEPFSAAYPGYRADAQLLAQDLFNLGPNLYTQYLFFASVVCRYLAPHTDEAPVMLGPNACAAGEPSAEDWADAITLTPQEREAIARALRERWIDQENVDRLAGRDARERRIMGLPGHGTADARKVPEVMAAYYRQQAERHLFRVPTGRVMAEAVVPTTLDEWEPGDAVRAIDWIATLQQRGALYGAASALKREPVADYEGLEVPTWRPRIEIYLDVSGSMPNPVMTLNAMTLAAQILAMAAIRAEGSARALMYSVGTTDYWTWCRSEIEMSRFLMHYIGGGTEFPFERLAASVEECTDQQPHRVLITDRDFDANIDASPRHEVIVSQAAARAPLVMLLHRPVDARVSRYQGLGATVVPVADLDDFPRMAAALSRALFGGATTARR